MKVAVRAYRILFPMENFRKDWPQDVELLKIYGDGMGVPLGGYKNPDEDGEVVGFFDAGVAWRDGERVVKVKYSDLAEVDLSNEKESKSLVLVSKDGRRDQLPMLGQKGKFFDSMTFLRFFLRVMDDLKEG
ncbi:hypothetical protein M8R20_30160 [Pseudomonas sp. R2.Fl]|nr:hypothetical protein [Pseudomonas sp. R2.Fl]